MGSSTAGRHEFIAIFRKILALFKIRANKIIHWILHHPLDRTSSPAADRLLHTPTRRRTPPPAPPYAATPARAHSRPAPRGAMPAITLLFAAPHAAAQVLPPCVGPLGSANAHGPKPCAEAQYSPEKTPTSPEKNLARQRRRALLVQHLDSHVKHFYHGVTTFWPFG